VTARRDPGGMVTLPASAYPPRSPAAPGGHTAPTGTASPSSGATVTWTSPRHQRSGSS
jgi:hypothetical protein